MPLDKNVIYTIRDANRNSDLSDCVTCVYSLQEERLELRKPYRQIESIIGETLRVFNYGFVTERLVELHIILVYRVFREVITLFWRQQFRGL